MSLFTSALGGAGVAAGQVADDYLKRDAAMDLQAQAGAIQKDRDAFVNQLKMQSDAAASDLAVKAHAANATFDVSPDQAAGQGALSAAIAKGKNDNTTFATAPGTQLITGKGDMVGGNTNMTATDALLAGAKEKDPSIQAGKEAAAAAKQNKDEFFKLNTPDKYKDESGKLDSSRWSFVTDLGGKAVDSGANPVQATAKAQAAYDKAAQFVADNGPTPRSLGHPFTGAQDPATQRTMLDSVLKNIRSGDVAPADTFNAKNYDDTGKFIAPTASPAPASSGGAPAAAPPPSGPAQLPAPVEDTVPVQPPENLTNPVRPNPAYADWIAKYGDVIASRQTAQAARSKSLAEQMQERLHPSGRSYPAGAM